MAAAPPARVRVQIKFAASAPIDYEIGSHLPLRDQIAQLCEQFKAPGPREKYALMFEHSNQYVPETTADLAASIPSNAVLRLKLLPKEEAQQTLAALRDTERAKKACVELKSQIKDPGFAREFLHSGGFAALVELVLRCSGNTLAYALQALDSALSFGFGYRELKAHEEAVLKIVAAAEHGAGPASSTNAVRAALDILSQLVRAPAGLGFQLAVMMKAQADRDGREVFGALVRALDNTDLHTKLAALTLLNALTQAAPNEKERASLQEQLKALGVLPALKKQTAIEQAPVRAQVFLAQQLLFAPIRADRATPYDKQASAHEQLLLLLWRTLFPHEELSGRVSEQWKRLGFQGTDPATDFRGAGLLGLKNLLYLAVLHRDQFLRLLERDAARRERSYPVATAGINLSVLLFELLHVGDDPGPAVAAAAAAGPSAAPPPDLPLLPLLFDHAYPFEEIYCAAFDVLDQLWDQMNASYMDFPRVIAALRRQLQDALDNHRDSLLTLLARLDPSRPPAVSLAPLPAHLLDAYQASAPAPAASFAYSGPAQPLQPSPSSAPRSAPIALAASVVVSNPQPARAVPSSALGAPALLAAEPRGAQATLAKLKGKIFNDTMDFVRAAKLAHMKEPTSFKDLRLLLKAGGGSVVPRGSPASGGSSGTIVLRLSENQSELQFGSEAELNAATNELPHSVRVADITGVAVGRDCPLLARVRKPVDEAVVGLSISLLGKDSTTLFDVAAVSRQDFAQWSDGMRALLGERMEAPDTLEDVRALADAELEIRLLDMQPSDFPADPPPLPEPPRDYDFFYEDALEARAAAPATPSEHPPLPALSPRLPVPASSRDLAAITAGLPQPQPARAFQIGTRERNTSVAQHGGSGSGTPPPQPPLAQLPRPVSPRLPPAAQALLPAVAARPPPAAKALSPRPQGSSGSAVAVPGVSPLAPAANSVPTAGPLSAVLSAQAPRSAAAAPRTSPMRTAGPPPPTSASPGAAGPLSAALAAKPPPPLGSLGPVAKLPAKPNAKP